MFSSLINRIWGTRHSLKVQLVILYLVINLVVSGVSYFIIYSILLGNIQERNEEATNSQFKNIQTDIRTIQENLDRAFLGLISDEYMEEFLSVNELDEIEYIIAANEIYKRMSNIIDTFPSIDSVFIFSQNGATLGYTSKKRTVKTGSGQESHPFYKSQLYLAARKSNKFVMQGNIKKDFFIEPVPGTPYNEKQFLVSFARRFDPTYKSSQMGVVVFNLDEHSFISTYANYKGEIKIIDGSGIVISSPVTSEIGTRYPFISRINQKEPSKKLIYKKLGKTIQIIPYKMDLTDWILVREIPLDIMKQDFWVLQNVVVMVFLANIIFVLIISLTSVNRMVGPLKQLADKMKALEKGDIGTQINEIPNNEIGFLTNGFNKMSTSISELILKNRDIEEDKRRIEMEMLQYQINPHFLFNTLNMIKWMALTVNARHVADAISTLGNMIGPVFRDKEDMHRLSDEMDYIMNYIRILNLRYNKGVCIEVDIPEEVRNYKILRFILQPLIENCFIHGLTKVDYEKNIEIRAEQSGTDLKIYVVDDGTGIDEGRLKEIKQGLENIQMEENGTRKIGVRNIQRRIQLHFGLDYGLNIENGDQRGTIVTVKVPVIT